MILPAIGNVSGEFFHKFLVLFVICKWLNVFNVLDVILIFAVHVNNFESFRKPSFILIQYALKRFQIHEMVKVTKLSLSENFGFDLILDYKIVLRCLFKFILILGGIFSHRKQGQLAELGSFNGLNLYCINWLNYTIRYNMLNSTHYLHDTDLILQFYLEMFGKLKVKFKNKKKDFLIYRQQSWVNSNLG